jgi:predicted amidohydrolase YtcJ
MPPVVTARRLGVKVGGGSDAHRVASYNPFLVLQWLLSGRTVSGLQLRSPQETPSREDALRHYTIDAAWFSFDEHQRGSLEPGKLADFAVLDQDVMTVPLERIERTQSLMTVLGGRVVHAVSPFAAPR